uniref:RNase H type-1 domain-containing protein n=1 Tax=Fagus sylvatica TaxID=28930 RepID=A0A2N9E2N4_FAGSY
MEYTYKRRPSRTFRYILWLIVGFIGRRPSTTQYTPQYEKSTFCLAQRNRNRRQEDRSGRGFNERFNSFTPLNAPVDHIFMQIRNDPALKWPGKLLTDPDKRPRDKYCRFHRDHGHNTEDCYDLKRQIEELIKQGKLQRFIEKGGTSRSSRKAYARQIHNVLVTQKSNKKPRVEDLPITFTEEDACKVFHPHDDALVVTMEIAGYSTRRVLIDNGSSADIIYLTAFQQMKIDKDQLQPIETPLVGFAGTSIYPLGMVTLQIIAGTHPKQAIKKVNFLVVDCPFAYNVIIGRPTLNRLRAVTSTYHLLVRFPTENGIGEMKGDQAMARECYLTTVNAEQVHQTLIVEERQNIAEPTEELEEIVLIEGDEKKTTRIGTSIRASVVSFLRGNADVFAWSHDDMPGISTEVISHKLNVNPSTPPIRQKRRVFAPERNTAVMEEVDKLLKAGFIREVYYPEWLANVVMVKKSTGKWRTCVDFTDLNKACPKDSYPLPRIDQLVDSTAGHKLLSFMDAFSGYNQIQMTEGDQEKTAFITSRGLFCYKRGIEANLDKIKAILDMSPPKTVKEVQSLTGKAAALNRKAMNKPDAAGRLVQWSIEMSEFHIDYRPRTAIKAQALADFIAEFIQPWKDEEELEEGEAWTVNIDGSSTKEMSGNGVVLVSPEKDKFEYALQLRFRATNNEAEYEALLAGLKLSKSMGIENLTVKSDSQLIVGQVKGEYEAKEDRMKRYLTVVKNLLTQFKKVELLQIPREENEAADRLARLASSGVEIDGFVEIQGRPSTEEETINPISFTTTWMLPIIRYLKEGTLPADRAEAHKFRIRASRFQLLGGILYKMGFSKPHLRCLSPEEANYVIREVHEGVCGNHSEARSLAHKLTRAGYYWPSLLHDATQFVKAYDKCQRFANVPRVPPEEFTPITSPWPFAQWGLDIMGPFPVGMKQEKFLVVAIDYFTKWVEAEPLATISEKNVKSFVWKAVICRFGIPMIKTRLAGAKSMWVEELPSVLWAYRTTVRTPTKETPFKLTFGTEAGIPIEIGLTTLRTTFHKEENEGQLRLNLDLLDKKKEAKAAQRIALYQGKMTRYYNTKVKLRCFEVGDWVLRKSPKQLRTRHRES